LTHTTHNRSSSISAKRGLLCAQRQCAKKYILAIKDSDNLEQETGSSIYGNFPIDTITAGKDNEFLI